mmetsp:Transcript_4779/g.7657  ORF Transcript_4779/g.7657 Transcript_4779/m.7657 type:complete len:91 (-) Transcript_4779:85-357(-)
MQLQLSDGNLESFEMNAERLQGLRYDVARALKEMQELEQSPLYRLSGKPASSAKKPATPGAPAPNTKPKTPSAQPPPAAQGISPDALPNF